jgi:ABC-type antimicrobial peptide transport system permease subunit
MLKHTFVLIYRNFRRFKSTFYINLIGLTAGFACALLIFLWIADELSFDKYHQHDERLYQVMYHEKANGDIKTTGQTPYFLSDALKTEIPGIEYAAVATPPLFFPDFTISCNGKFAKGIGKFVEKDFFLMFSYDLLAGNAKDVLSDKNSVVISESLAKNLFNSTENAIGKSFDYELLHLKKQVFISGVFRNVPDNSSEQFDFILSFQIIRDLMGLQNQAYNWDFTDPFYTYLVLKDGVDVHALNKQLEDYITTKSKTSPFRLFLKSFSSNYLYGKYENGQPDGGRIDYVVLFSIIGVFILIIACINFINLSTAKARTRLKEIGIKKVIGASRKSLVIQYLGETGFLSCLSLLISLIVVQLILPEFNVITGKSLQLKFDLEGMIVLISVALTAGLIAGIYPALYISGFQPAKIFKGNVSGSLRELVIRKGLVVFQFALSITFIISVLVIYHQIRFIQSKDLGYKKNNLLYFSADGNINGKASVFLEEVRKFHGVVMASSMFGSLTGQGNGLPGFIEYNGKKIVMFQLAVNYDMLETLGIQIKEGRSFSQSLDGDADTLKWIFNEAATKAMGKSNIVGEIISDREVIGVVKNFHYQSLHEEVKPFAFRLEPYYSMDIWVRVQAGKESETIDYLEKMYSQFNPGLPFNYTFLDQAYKAQYVSEQRVAVLAKYFASLAIIISCLGLYGLASFTAERRKKEIGIRKVFGSSEMRIVYLLSSDFTRLVLMAIVLAIPVSYFATREWLNSFAYNVGLEWWYFIGGSVLSLLIAWMTVGILTLKAAQANPVESLKYE